MVCFTDYMMTVISHTVLVIFCIVICSVHGRHALTCKKINKLKHSLSNTEMAVLLGLLPVASNFHIDNWGKFCFTSEYDCRLMKPQACGATAENLSIPFLLIINEID